MHALKLTFLSAALVAGSAAVLPISEALSAATCPLRGSCNLESGLVDRTDLYLFEDFEASNWASHFTKVDFPSNLTLVSSPAYAGTKSLRAAVPNGSHDGGSMIFDFTSAGVAEPEEAYLRYYIRFNDTWQINGDGEIGKLPGFAGTYDSGAGQGCGKVNGTNAWSARMINYDNGSTNQVGFYTYHVNMPGDCGEHMMWSPKLNRNQWYAVEARVKLNTVGASDGILQGWIDGQLVFSKTNLRFRNTTALKVERIWGNIYVGGSWTADRSMELHFDNMVIARNYIGTGSGVSMTPPSAPTNLRIIR